MAMIACGGTPSTSEEGDEETGAGGETGGDVGVPASSATQEGVGVDRWQVSKSGAVGYEASRAAVTYRYGTTQVSTDTIHTTVDLQDGTSVSHYEFDTQYAADGKYRVANLQRTEPNRAASLRTLKLLGADLSATLKRSKGLASQSLRPLDLVKGGAPLTSGCWSEEVVHVDDQVFILTTTEGPNGTWNTSVSCGGL